MIPCVFTVGNVVVTRVLMKHAPPGSHAFRVEIVDIDSGDDPGIDPFKCVAATTTLEAAQAAARLLRGPSYEKPEEPALDDGDAGDDPCGAW